MLQITIPETELFDEVRQEFIYVRKPVTLTLEHSLVSISKWESKWKKPYLSNDEPTPEEVIDYVRCMTITQNVDPEVYYALTMDNLKEIEAYIKDPYSATTITEYGNGPKRNKEKVTSELVYYWMCAYQIPFEAQKWHFNRLMNLIRIAGIKNSNDNKMSRKDAMKSQREINAMRRAKHKSKG